MWICVFIHILSLFNKKYRRLKLLSSGQNSVVGSLKIHKIHYFFARNILKINVQRPFIVSKSQSRPLFNGHCMEEGLLPTHPTVGPTISLNHHEITRNNKEITVELLIICHNMISISIMSLFLLKKKRKLIKNVII